MPRKLLKTFAQFILTILILVAFIGGGISYLLWSSWNEEINWYLEKENTRESLSYIFVTSLAIGSNDYEDVVIEEKWEEVEQFQSTTEFEPCSWYNPDAGISYWDRDSEGISVTFNCTIRSFKYRSKRITIECVEFRREENGELAITDWEEIHQISPFGRNEELCIQN